MSLLVLDVVGLTPALLRHAPRLRALAEQGWQAELGTVLPAVTCSVQSTFLTGTLPTEHGIVGNGWYSRDIGEVNLWRQHNKLVEGPKVWETARERQPGFTVANVCWWYAMGASTDLTVTPRPVYHADGRKSPDCYTRPPELHDELTEALGPFPLFQYWGPTASIASTRWIVEATRMVMPRVDMTLAYLPHLDYDLQRFGPDAPEAVAAVQALDEVVAPLLDDAAAAGTTVVVLSEYGITAVDQPVHVNRALREAGLLEVYVQDGRELLDPWTSRAFAVADHQVAHVYVADPADVAQVRASCRPCRASTRCSRARRWPRPGLAHGRSGELVAVAAERAWFTYYYWLDDARAPDFARGVEIHKKPGYDPAELFLDPADPTAKLRAGPQPGAEEGGAALHDGRGPPGRPLGQGQPRPAPRGPRRRARPHLLGPRGGPSALRGDGGPRPPARPRRPTGRGTCPARHHPLRPHGRLLEGSTLMCFGFDTTTPALRAAEAGTGPDRRALLRGAGIAAIAGGTVALAGAPAQAAGRRPEHSRLRRPPPVRAGQISIQMYTLRSITERRRRSDSVLGTLSSYGYRKVELAGRYGYTAAHFRDLLDSQQASTPAPATTASPPWPTASRPTPRPCTPSSRTPSPSASASSTCRSCCSNVGRRRGSAGRSR